MELKKYATVRSKYTGRRGIISKVEHDQFHNCLMYLVDFEPQICIKSGKEVGFECWWFKAYALSDTTSDELIAYPVWDEKDPKKKLA